MNEMQLEKKVRQDAAKIKKDLGTLLEDSSAGINSFGDSVAQSAAKSSSNLTKKVENGISQVSSNVEKLAGDAKDSVVNTATSVKNDVGNGLSNYNAKAQKVVDKVPGNIGKKAAKYPWVTITIALVVGIWIGSMVRPNRRPLM
jgi:ElaB/YqjD/DUF883 family membrane-anchored ribosome-binding protein